MSPWADTVRSVSCKAEHGRAGQGWAGQGGAGQGRAGQGRVGQGTVGQGRAGLGRAVKCCHHTVHGVQPEAAAQAEVVTNMLLQMRG